MRRNLKLLILGAASLLVCGFGPQGDGFKRERSGNATDAAKDAIEGKAPPALVATAWANSNALKLAALKGKVVLLDFWAYW